MSVNELTTYLLNVLLSVLPCCPSSDLCCLFVLQTSLQGDRLRRRQETDARSEQPEMNRRAQAYHLKNLYSDWKEVPTQARNWSNSADGTMSANGLTTVMLNVLLVLHWSNSADGTMSVNGLTTFLPNVLLSVLRCSTLVQLCRWTQEIVVMDTERC